MSPFQGKAKRVHRDTTYALGRAVTQLPSVDCLVRAGVKPFFTPVPNYEAKPSASALSSLCRQ